MEAGLKITVVDPDDDYLGIEIRAWNDRFAGTTRIFAGLEDLSELAAQIAGFPARIPDERTFQFGTRDPHYAGGYCGLCFRTVDSVGHAVVEIDVQDDDQLYSPGISKFSIPVEAAAVDRFVIGLRTVQAARSGETGLVFRQGRFFGWHNSLSCVLRDASPHNSESCATNIKKVDPEVRC